MTLKVVRTNSEYRGPLEAPGAEKKPATARPLPAEGAAAPAGSEAVRNQVRAGARSIPEGSRIKDIRTARETAGDIAEKLAEGSSPADETHADLDKVSATEHLRH